MVPLPSSRLDIFSSLNPTVQAAPAGPVNARTNTRSLIARIVLLESKVSFESSGLGSAFCSIQARCLDSGTRVLQMDVIGDGQVLPISSCLGFLFCFGFLSFLDITGQHGFL
jgi:hypothetical protein